MKMSKEDFIYVWRDSTREDILNQYYYDRKELMDTIDKAIEYTTKQMKKYEGYDRGFEIVLSNIVIMLGSDSNDNSNNNN